MSAPFVERGLYDGWSVNLSKSGVDPTSKKYHIGDMPVRLDVTGAEEPKLEWREQCEAQLTAAWDGYHKDNRQASVWRYSGATTWDWAFRRRALSGPDRRGRGTAPTREEAQQRAERAWQESKAEKEPTNESPQTV